VLNKTTIVGNTVESGLGGQDVDWEAPTLQPPDEGELDDEVLVDATDALEVDDVNLKDAGVSGDTSEVVKPAAAEADDEYVDMEDESLALDDATVKPAVASSGTKESGATEASSALLRSRRYDVSITYDNYYRCPRIWLFGYDENGSPLTPEAVFQDVMQDYAKKTVTIDPHPHISRPHASIHPCQV
jgi:ubiquitin-like-conjugating enzyme ATG3